MIRVDVNQAKITLSELIQKAITGEEIIIEKDSNPVVKLISVNLSPQRKIGSARGMIWIAEDFNVIPEGFYKLIEK